MRVNVRPTLEVKKNDLWTLSLIGLTVSVIGLWDADILNFIF